MHIEIFTDSQHPIDCTQGGIQVKADYYELNDAQPLLPENSSTTYNSSSQTRWSRSYQGALLAHNYNLTHYPAIVFNQGEAVVYGKTSIFAALAEYLQSHS